MPQRTRAETMPKRPTPETLARFAAIVGEDEAATGAITLRDLRSDRPQEQVAIGDLADTIRRLTNEND